ncbi:uncharacterized protein LOC122256944 [Penaeus japonicus]|uniref:uncharacterized protein LOC122256944 n=1 Tax=Penaeus japonicus TaxID=27405 RepID=UPI001C717722|nr:uncharacterized protein LOC122256944 [Penaeus japonicus]
MIHREKSCIRTVSELYQSCIRAALSPPMEPNVCEYQREETIEVRVPRVRAFTASVRVYRPGCFLNIPSCITHERRTQYKTVHQYQEEVVTERVFRCCPGWTAKAVGADKGGRRHAEDEEDSAANTGCLIRAEEEANATSEVTHEGKVYRLVEGRAEEDPANGTHEEELILPRFTLTSVFDDEDADDNGTSHGSTGDATTTEESDATPSPRLPHHRRRHARHRHRPSPSETPALDELPKYHPLHRRRHQFRGDRHHRRHHRHRAPTSRDEDVEANTTILTDYNSNTRRQRSHEKDEGFDAYSYTIILTEGKKGGRRNDDARRPQAGHRAEHVSRVGEVVEAGTGRVYGKCPFMSFHLFSFFL